jgi:arylsulfatase A-like enzyme
MKIKSYKHKIRILIVILVVIFIIGEWIFICSEHSDNTNVVVITIDALRPDHLGCYGYGRNTSPSIDVFAEDSVLFAQAISQASVTIASLASFVTAVYPVRHRIITQHLDYDRDLSYPTIMEILKEQNYEIATFFAHPLLDRVKWIKRKVDFHFQTKYYKDNSHQINSYSAADLTNAVLDWISRKPKNKFFIWMHYIDPHTPYLPPHPYDKLYINDEYYNSDKTACFVDNLEGRGGIPPDVAIKNISEVDYYIAQYDGEIKYVDKQIGRLIKNLKELDLYKNTLIIISADHGESLGEHNIYFEHAAGLYDESIKVPLIIKLPQEKFRGKIVNKQVRVVDIMPSILNILNLKVLKNIDGESLYPVITGGDMYKSQYSFSKTAAMSSLRTDNWKLIYYEDSNNYELFNLKKDCKELNNLYNAEDKITAVLKGEMKNLLKSNLYKQDEDCVNKTTKDILRSLGYTN